MIWIMSNPTAWLVYKIIGAIVVVSVVAFDILYMIKHKRGKREKK